MKTLEFTGTKGHWYYQEESDAYTHIVRPNDNPGRIIAHGGQDTSGITESNLRLIAAAPNLLEACQTVVDGYETDGMENMQARDEVFYKSCKEAITKALNKAI